VTQAEEFWNEAVKVVEAHAARLRDSLTYGDARSLPPAESSDIVILGKEVLLTIFSQADVPFLKDQVLVTVQVSRHTMGGMSTSLRERGLVFSADAPPRQATEDELKNSGA
jgi:hypothetical protein